MTQLTSWDSAQLLDWLRRALHLHGASSQWWTRHGARLLDVAVISASALLCALAALVLWRLFSPRSKGRDASLRALWMSLLLIAFGGPAAAFVLFSLPSQVANSQYLFAHLSRLERPVYTDPSTAANMSYLVHYMPLAVQLSVFSPSELERLLTVRRGCIIVNQPELDTLQSKYDAPVSPRAYTLLRQVPRGWRRVIDAPSPSNPLERIGALCAGR